MTRTTRKAPPSPDSPPDSGDVEPFFSLQSVAVSADGEEASLDADIGEEEPTIRDQVGKIPAFHSLNLPVVDRENGEEDDDASDDDEALPDLDAPTQRAPAVEARPSTPPRSRTSGGWSSTTETPVADPSTRFDDTWTEFEDGDDSLILSSDSLEGKELSEDLDDSLEWGRSGDDDDAILTPDTVPRAGGLRDAAEQMTRESREEESASVSIAVEEDSADEDSQVPDPAGETVPEAFAPDLGASGAADKEPSGEFVSGLAALLQEGIEALHAGERERALASFQAALRCDPDDTTALSYLELVHEMLIREHLPQASLRSVPRLCVGREMLMTLELEPNAGGVLAMVDGVATIEDLETMLPYFDRVMIYRHLADAYKGGLIEFDS